MMLTSIGMNILSVIVFILCISLVVMIHEAGHLVVAKICGVYCDEFSIGFGPQIYTHKFKHKIKKDPKTGRLLLKDGEPEPLYKESKDGLVAYREGETKFSIRALPLGGYVTMATEDSVAEGDANIIVPKTRILEGVNHLKQLCIMLAGICMNFLLAWILFFCCFAFCNQQRYAYDKANVSVTEKLNDEESLAYKAGLRSDDRIVTISQKYYNLVTINDTVNDNVVGTNNLEFNTSPKEITSYLSFIKENQTSGYLFEYSDTSLVYQVQDVISRRYEESYKTGDDEFKNKYYQNEFLPFKDMYANKNSYRELVITVSGKDAPLTIRSNASKVDDGSSYHYIFEKIGISPTIEKYKVGFAKAFDKASNEFENLFVNIYVALGSLFTPKGWSQMGGIISVYKVSAAGFTSGSIGYFLRLWGYISLNLGCFNLLPFPGLDGWQSLIAIIEMISRKKIPSKIKNIANTVGLIVMMILAGVLIIKDLIKPINLIKLLK